MTTKKPYVCVFLEMADRFPEINIRHAVVLADGESHARHAALDAYHSGNVDGSIEKDADLLKWCVAPLEGDLDSSEEWIRLWYYELLAGAALGHTARRSLIPDFSVTHRKEADE